MSAKILYLLPETHHEYDEMNIQQFNRKIDDNEDEIHRKKLKLKKVSGESNDTLDDVMYTY
jgi:hypothetical protein